MREEALELLSFSMTRQLETVNLSCPWLCYNV